MYHAVPKRQLILAALTLTMSVPVLSADRCNTKFTFHNKYSFPITVKEYVDIRGNRGDYREQLDKSRVLQPGARATTRQNRLQKVDDGTRGEFKISVFSQYGWIGSSSNWRVAGDGRNNAEQHGTLLVNKRCEDGKFIVFEIKPRADTPANRQQVLGDLPSDATAQQQWDALARELNVLP